MTENKEEKKKRTWKCIGECQREFTFGEWYCFPGVKHLVGVKSYYIADAPHLDVKNDPEGLAFKASRTDFWAVPETTTVDSTTGHLSKSQPPPVTFIRGRYDTQDPEQQFFIERSGIDCGYDRWFQAYHTPLQKQRIKDKDQGIRENQLREREQELERREKEANELLAQVQSKAKKPELAAK